MQPILQTPLQTLWRSLKIVFQASPTELINLTVLNLVSGAGPAIVLFLNKIIIDEASRLIGTTTHPLETILQEHLLLWSVGGVIILNLLTRAMGSISNFVFTSLRDRIQFFVEKLVLYKIANYEGISLFEEPELLNLVQLSEQGVQRLRQLSMIIISTLNGIFMLLPSVLLSGAITWWVPLVLISTTVPSVYVELKYRKQSWRVERTQATLARERNLYKEVLMGERYAKELRLFDLQSLLLLRWESLFNRIFKAMQKVRRKGTVSVIAWSMFSGLGSALPYVYVIFGVLRGVYTLGDLALYAGLILQVRQSLFSLISNGSDLYDVVLGASPIFQLLDLQPRSTNLTLNTSSQLDTGVKKLTEIQIQNLSFAYPGSEKQTLDNINLTIHPNEMIVLVGENGAGKTTLAKLLCRLYEPTSGKILWNGQDLRELDQKELHARIAVVMQDYARFPATVRENVGFGYLASLENDDIINDAIDQAGMTKVVTNLPAGLENLLGKQLEGGVDLSGGQWQRIALARSLMRLASAELLIFDEPTAALDPKTENEIYDIFRTIATNRMAVVVSHRLALAKQADRIVVLENGKIIETGTHDELLALGGQYCVMFTRQAASYQ
ncbi:MAG: ABC transporter ATP-binding protein [Nostocaceae cyanobacterium]|nr:ABC transporter ATP-binding protein [Nostocaceae cyanobacterium]